MAVKSWFIFTASRGNTKQEATYLTMQQACTSLDEQFRADHTLTTFAGKVAAIGVHAHGHF